jgi:hypothetical protein
MTARKRIALIAICLMSLLTIALLVHAQAQAPAARGPEPQILSGSDIGFRVERPGKDSVGGTLMVRVNGKWLPAEMVEKVVPTAH